MELELVKQEEEIVYGLAAAAVKCGLTVQRMQRVAVSGRIRLAPVPVGLLVAGQPVKYGFYAADLRRLKLIRLVEFAARIRSQLGKPRVVHL